MADSTADSPASEEDWVDVAKAVDTFEAAIWANNLEERGIEVGFKKKGGLLRFLLYLGRVPVAVQVRRKDYDRAYAYLKQGRYIL